MVARSVPEQSLSSIPRHVAVIMDGNGRWARNRLLPRLAGHKAGIEPVRRTVEHCAGLGVRTLTLFAFSSENWQRPPAEVRGLMSLFLDALNREVAELDANGIRLKFIGNREQLSTALARATREMVGDLAHVEHAVTLDETLRIFGEREVAVLVADLESRRVDNTVLFKILKQEHPGTLVIVTTKASDSELIISLINEARIFRFVNKPVNLTLLQTHIVAALERYHSFKQAPALMKTQKTLVSQEIVESTAGRSILASLRALGGRFASAFRG